MAPPRPACGGSTRSRRPPSSSAAGSSPSAPRFAQGDVGGPRLAAAVYLVGGDLLHHRRLPGLLLVANAPRGADPDGHPAHAALALVVAGAGPARLVRRRHPLRRHPLLLRQPAGRADRRPLGRPGPPPRLVAGIRRLHPLPRLRPDRPDRDLARPPRPASGSTSAGGSRSSTSSARSSSWSPRSPPSSGPQPATQLAVGVANWGTLTGALCFAVAGAMQEFERPADPADEAPPAAPGAMG